MLIKFDLNNESVEIETSLSKRLLDVIREDFDLTGTKEGCAEGECGACLLYLDDQLVNSCIVPMANVIGKHVYTIEAFSKTAAYQRIEEALLSSGGVQCGFCIPGMVMAIHELLKSNQKPDDEAIKEGLSGNLCRCTGYQTIFDAVKLVVEGGPYV